MNSVSGLTQASYAALEGIGRAVERVDQSAAQVAASPESMSFARQFEALTQIHNAGLEIAANTAVLDTVNSLYHELSQLPRK